MLSKTTNTLLDFSKATGVEIFAIELLVQKTKSQPEHLKTYFSINVFTDEGRTQDVSNGEKVVLLPGVCFKTDSNNIGYEIILSVRPQLERKGYRLFLTGGNNMNDQDNIAIVRCSDEFTPLIYLQTNGVNYGIETSNLVFQLQNLNKELDLKLIGADFDWCEFEIRKSPQDWSGVAETIFHLCPDIVDEGFGDIKEFERELAHTKQLHFWWD